jgi:hypothetical protein
MMRSFPTVSSGTPASRWICADSMIAALLGTGPVVRIGTAAAGPGAEQRD